MANQNVETVTSMADRLKVLLAIAIVVLGVVGFYVLAQQPTVVRVGSVLEGRAVVSLPSPRIPGLRRVG